MGRFDSFSPSSLFPSMYGDRKEPERKRVLVVEDETLIAQMIARSLIRLGYEVGPICPRADDVYKVFETWRPDLVLVDVHLEGEVDGVAVAEAIRERWGIPVVYLSALLDNATLDRAKITQPFGYIAKPFSQRELEITLEIALYKSSLERKLQEQEFHYQSIIEQFGTGFSLLDAQQKILYANLQFAGSLKRTPEELVGVSMREFIEIPTTRDAERYAAWMSGQPFETELRGLPPPNPPAILTAHHAWKDDGILLASFVSIIDARAIVKKSPS